MFASAAGPLCPPLVGFDPAPDGHVEGDEVESVPEKDISAFAVAGEPLATEVALPPTGISSERQSRFRKGVRLRACAWYSMDARRGSARLRRA